MNDIAADPAAALSNNPPIGEVLAEETAPFKARATALIGSVGESRIDSPETAAAVTTLGNMLNDLRTTVETARKERAKPFDDGKAAVQTAYKRDIIDPIDSAIATCRRMVDEWRNQLARQEAAEKRKRDDDAAAAQRAAEEAQRKKEEAQATGDVSAAIKAEVEEVQARDRAEALSGAPGTIRPDATIRTQAGSAGTAKIVTGKIDNVGLCLAWMIRHDAAWLLETLQPRVDRLTRTGMTIDGVSRVETSGTRFRR